MAFYADLMTLLMIFLCNLITASLNFRSFIVDKFLSFSFPSVITKIYLNLLVYWSNLRFSGYRSFESRGSGVP